MVGEKKTKLMLYSTKLKLKLKLELSLAIENTEINSYRGVHIDMIIKYFELYQTISCSIHVSQRLSLAMSS